MRQLTRLAPFTLLLCLLFYPGAAIAEANPSEDSVLTALGLELERSMELLAAKEQKPYFIGLEAIEVQLVRITGEEGGLHGYVPGKRRWVHADIRLGEPRMDSTHPLRDSDADYSSSGRTMGVGDDVGVLRRSIWAEVEKSYRESRERMQQVQADQQVLVKEENRAWDLAPSVATTDLREPASLASLNYEELENSVRDASAIFNHGVTALDPSVSVSVEAVTQWFVSSEGHSLRHSTTRFRLAVSADAIAADGDRL